MLHTISLIVHLIGAVSLFTFFIASVVAVVKSIDSTYKKLILAVGGNALLQIVSGTVLFLSTGNTMSGGQFCARLSVYVVMTLGIEGMLVYKVLRSEERDLLLTKKA